MEMLAKKFGCWNVRIIRKGENYGRNDCLLHNEEKELVSFYDTRGTILDNALGELTPGTYYKKTLLENEERKIYPLSLHGACPEWTVSADDMKNIIEWLEKN